MKKTLIALATLGMVAGAAQASNVTIYGQLQPSYDFMTVKAPAKSGLSSQPALDEDYTNMNDNASRIGFKGSEDLGNGLQAIFKLESYFNIVDGNGFDGSRDAYVGLKGDFGSVMFGKIDTTYKTISSKYDAFGDTIGDYNSIMGMAPSVVDGWGGNYFAADANNRDSKTVKYVSPCMNGIKVMANYTLDGSADETTKAWGVGATYDNGPLNVLAAYEKQSNVNGDDDQEAKFWKVGASYQIDAIKLKALYEKAERPTFGSPWADGDADRNAFFLGADFALNGNTTLMASYINAGDFEGKEESGAKAWNLGVNYKLSKRTSIQGIYSYLKNDVNGAYTNDAGYGAYGESVWSVGSEAVELQEGGKISGFSVRLQHKF